MNNPTLNPFRTDAEFGENENVMRRLFEVTYTCPLCDRQHHAEVYVSHPTSNLDDLHAHAVRSLRSNNFGPPLLIAHTRMIHLDQGNYQALRERADAGLTQGLLRIESIVMTAEEHISCDDCAQRFQTIGDLWNHMGIDPRSNLRVRSAECHAHSEV